MPRRDNARNPLEIRLRLESLPRRVSPITYYKRLLRCLDSGGDLALPDLWEVRVEWRNRNSRGRTRFWQDGEFSEVVADSAERGGFNSILRGAIQSRLNRVIREGKR
jgi:hypothetical protein